MQDSNQDYANIDTRTPPAVPSQLTYAVLLNGHIGEVNKHVVKLPGTVVVLDSAEPAEPLTAPISVGTGMHGQARNYDILKLYMKYCSH